MKRERYSELKGSQKVVRMNRSDVNQKFRSWGNTLIISFSFFYPSFPANASILNSLSEDSKRIVMEVGSPERYRKIVDLTKLPVIDDEILIMTMADFELYAMTFKLRVNEAKGSASLILLDEPEYGKRFISGEERAGIIRYL